MEKRVGDGILRSGLERNEHFDWTDLESIDVRIKSRGRRRGVEIARLEELLQLHLSQLARKRALLRERNLIEQVEQVEQRVEQRGFDGQMERLHRKRSIDRYMRDDIQRLDVNHVGVVRNKSTAVEKLVHSVGIRVGCHQIIPRNQRFRGIVQFIHSFHRDFRGLATCVVRRMDRRAEHHWVLRSENAVIHLQTTKLQSSQQNNPTLSSNRTS